MLAAFDLVIVSAGGGKFLALGDLIAYARQNPGKVELGTPGVGTTQHLAAEWFKRAAQLELQVLPFKSTPDLITRIRSGRVDAGLDILGPLLAQIQSKALHPLAVTGLKRSRVLPDVPTAQSSGAPGLNATSWNGLAAPAKTPPGVIERLNTAVNAALADERVRARLESLNLDPQPGTPADAARMLRGDIQRWRQVIEQARIARQ